MVVVAAGEWRFLDVVGAEMLVGVLAQAIVTSLGYVGPRPLHLEPAAAVSLAEAWGAGRAVVWNAGVALTSRTASQGQPPRRSGRRPARSDGRFVLLAIAARVFVVPGRPPARAG